MNKLVFIENGFVEYTRMEVDASGNPFAQEYAAYVEKREDLETPHNCTAELEAPDVGAALDELESYAAEFHKLIEEMFEKLPTETRVLEGTEIASYDQLCEEARKNELSETKKNEDNGQCTGSVDS